MTKMQDDIQSAVMTKLANIVSDIFTHTTSAKNLRRILDAGELMSLKHLAEKLPQELVNVETGLSSLAKREALPAAEALEKMMGKKDVGSVFLTRGGWMPHYGDYTIAKMMPAPLKRTALNLIPEEYVSKIPLSLGKEDTTIYVPGEMLDLWKSMYPQYSFAPRSQFPGKTYSRLYGAGKLPKKALDAARDLIESPEIRPLRDMGIGKESVIGAGLGAAATAQSDPDEYSDYILPMLAGAGVGAGIKNLQGLGSYFAKRHSLDDIVNANPEKLKEIFGYNAMPAGSEALGTALKSSDTDIMLPFKTRYFFDRAVKDMERLYPELTPSALNAEKLNKKVFSYKGDGKDLDVVLAHGPKAFNFRDAFLDAKRALSDYDRAEIIGTKEHIKDSWLNWLTGDARYNRYKNRLASQLGLKDHYF